MRKHDIDIDLMVMQFQACDAQECEDCLADQIRLSDGTNMCTVLRKHDEIIKERIRVALETAKPLE